MNWLRIHVSNLCNFKCPNCHAFELGENNLPNRVMPQEVFDLAVSQFCQAMVSQGLKETKVSIYGGETLANKKVVQTGIAKFGASHLGIKLNWVINTNGSLLKEEDVAFFKEHNVELHVSVDGREEIHNLSRPTHKGKGTFHMVTPALELIRKHDAPAQINSYMMPSNYQHLKDIVDIAAEYGIKKLYLDQFYNTEMIQYRVGVDRYREVYFYGLQRGVQVAGPWGRVLRNLQDDRSKKTRLKYSLALDVNIDGSCYVPSLVAKTKQMGLRIDSFAKFVADGGWSGIVSAIEQEAERTCEGCELKESCYGSAIEQVRYHIGESAETKVSCDFYRDWLRFMTRRVYLWKGPKYRVLSVIERNHAEDLIRLFVEGLSFVESRLWPTEHELKLTIAEYDEEFALAHRQSLPRWVRATTLGDTLYHLGTRPTPALVHEIAHLWLNRYDRSVPAWFIEGVCEWTQHGGPDEQRVREALAERPLQSHLLELESGKLLIALDDRRPFENPLYIQAQAVAEHVFQRLRHRDWRVFFDLAATFGFVKAIREIGFLDVQELVGSLQTFSSDKLLK